MRARSTISSISKTPDSTVLWANGKKMGCALFLRETVEWQQNADMRYFKMEFSNNCMCSFKMPFLSLNLNRNSVNN